jgi:methylmalonyl-CoA/ethylmalonyl-CoA epimerase
MSLVAGLSAGRLDQLGIVVPDLKAAMDGYISALGVTFQVFEVDETSSAFSGSSAAFRIRIGVALMGLSSIELIQPVAGTTIYSEHLRNRGPGHHHIGVYVPSIDIAADELRQRGYPMLMEGHIDRLGRFAYFDAPDLHTIVEPLQLSIGLPCFLAEKSCSYGGVPATFW